MNRLTNKTLTVEQIAKLVDGEVFGDNSLEIKKVSPIDSASQNELTFLSNPKFVEKLNTTQAGCVLLSNDIELSISNTCLLYTSPSPRDTERSRMPSSA